MGRSAWSDYKRRYLAFALAGLLLGIPNPLRGSDAPRTNDSPAALGRIGEPAYDARTVRVAGKGLARMESGWLVVRIAGEPYERGLQHGRLLAREIAEFIRVLGRYHATADPETGWKTIRLVSSSLFLRKFDSELLEEMKGIADGAAEEGATAWGRPLDLLDIVAINCEIEASFLDEALDATPIGLEGKALDEPLNRARIRHEAHCSAFAATGPATADGKVVIGHLTMWNLFHARFLNVWLDIQPTQGHRVIMQAYPGAVMSGTDFYMNDRGLVLLETTIDQTRFEPDSRPLPLRVRRAMQYADSIDGIVRELSTGNNGLYTNEWLMADTQSNEIAMFELGTHGQRLWRSSRDEWFGGTRGFYWGCNNAKDLGVSLETVAAVDGTPANLVFRPTDRDQTWLDWFEKYNGKIDLEAAREAFTTPPLAASHSLDVKITTTDLMRDLTAVGRFGPPLPEPWLPTPAERQVYPETGPLIPNDWARLDARKLLERPAETGDRLDLSVDLEELPFGPGQQLGSAEQLDEDEGHPRHRPSWHGTLLPGADSDLWLAAAFAAQERLASSERDFPPERDPAVFAYGLISGYLSARARLGTDLALASIKPNLRDDSWYALAVGKGLMVLEAVRKQVGNDAYIAFMDQYGHDHAGKPANVAEFVKRASQLENGPAPSDWETWLGPDALASLDETIAERWAAGRFWSVLSFEREPRQTLIVYGTTRDLDAQKAAAEKLRRNIQSRWSNVAVPIVADRELQNVELPDKHLLLIGGPDSNSIAKRIEGLYRQHSATQNRDWPVRFGNRVFELGDEDDPVDDADERTGVIAAGPHPTCSTKSAVVFAGNSAEATWHVVDRLPLESQPELVIMPRSGPARGFVVPVYPPLNPVAGEHAAVVSERRGRAEIGDE